MSWYDSLTAAAGDVYSSAVQGGTDYFSSKINDFTSEPSTVAPTPAQTAAGVSGVSSGGGFLGGLDWQTMAAIASVLMLVLVFFRSK